MIGAGTAAAGAGATAWGVTGTTFGTKGTGSGVNRGTSRFNGPVGSGGDIGRTVPKDDSHCRQLCV